MSSDTSAPSRLPIVTSKLEVLLVQGSPPGPNRMDFRQVLIICFCSSNEHCKTEGSNMTEIGKHLAESPGHTVSFDDVQILSFEQHFRKRRILESFFIQQSKHTLLNDNLKYVPLYIFNLPQYLITQTT